MTQKYITKYCLKKMYSLLKEKKKKCFSKASVNDRFVNKFSFDGLVEKINFH